MLQLITCGRAYDSKMWGHKGKRSILDGLGGFGLAVLAFAGSIKSHRALAWLPVDLTIAAALLVLAAMLLLSVRDLKEGEASPRFLLPLVLWTMFLLPVAGISSSDEASSKIIILFTITLLCALAPYSVLRRQEGQTAFLLTLFIIGLFATVGSIFGSDNYANEYSNRVLLEGSTTITTAQMIGASVLLAFLSIFTRLPKTLRYLLLISVPFLLSVALFTGSRGPVISVVVSLFIVLVFAKSLRKYRIYGAVLGTLLVSLVFYQAGRGGSDGVQRILAFVAGDDTSQGSGRGYLYALALDLIGENPFGMGWGGYAYHGLGYPHNLFLELFGEGGIFVGLAAFMVIFMSFVTIVKKSNTLIGAAFLGIYVFALINSMFSSDINGNRLLWIMTFSAFAIGHAREHLNPQLGSGATTVKRKREHRLSSRSSPRRQNQVWHPAYRLHLLKFFISYKKILSKESDEVAAKVSYGLRTST